MANAPSDRTAGVSVWLHRLIIILFHFLVITVPFFFTAVNEELFEFNKMLLTYALTWLILGAWGARMVVEKRLIFRRTWFDLPLGLFVISQILATIFSVHPYTSVFGYYTRFHGGLLSTLTYTALFYAFISNVDRKQVPAFLLSTLAAAIGVSLYAIPEHFGHSPSCFILSNGQQFDVACWIQDVKNRVFGTFGQPNWLAAYAITLIPWALGLIGWSQLTDLLSQAGRRWFTLVCALSVGLLFATLLYTQSRSGLLGLSLGLVVLALGGGWLWLHQPVRATLAWWLGLGVICAGLFVVSGTTIAQNLLSSVLPTTPVAEIPTSPTPDQAPPVNRLEVGGITDSGDIRKIVWEGAFNIWQRYPLFGSGVETFAYSYYLDRPLAHNVVSEWNFLYNKAHNEFLNFLATTGVVGLVAYCVWLIAIMGVGTWGVLKAKLPSSDKWWLLGSTAGVVALTVSNALGFSTVMVSILLFLIPATWIVLLDSVPHRLSQWAKLPISLERRLSPPDTQLTSSQWLILGTLGLLTFYGLFMVWGWWQADHNYTVGKQYLQAGYISEGLMKLQAATLQSPHEALFYDELATSYSQVAASLVQQGEATTAAQLAKAAIQTSDKALELNNRHLNFYKSRARIFINLSALDPEYLKAAHQTLDQAITLAPTDAQLVYNLALIELALAETEAAQAHLEQAVEMKANYDSARVQLAQLYAAQGEYERAQAQYQYILDHISPNNEPVIQQLEEVRQRLATQSGQPASMSQRPN